MYYDVISGDQTDDLGDWIVTSWTVLYEDMYDEEKHDSESFTFEGRGSVDIDADEP